MWDILPGLFIGVIMKAILSKEAEKVYLCYLCYICVIYLCYNRVFYPVLNIQCSCPILILESIEECSNTLFILTFKKQLRLQKYS